MKGRIALLGVFVLALPVVASSAEVKAGAAASAKPHFEASQQVTEQATVVSVNKSKRTVKLRTEDGDTVSVEYGGQELRADQGQGHGQRHLHREARGHGRGTR